MGTQWRRIGAVAQQASGAAVAQQWRSSGAAVAQQWRSSGAGQWRNSGAAAGRAGGGARFLAWRRTSNVALDLYVLLPQVNLLLQRFNQIV